MDPKSAYQKVDALRTDIAKPKQPELPNVECSEKTFIHHTSGVYVTMVTREDWTILACALPTAEKSSIMSPATKFVCQPPSVLKTRIAKGMISAKSVPVLISELV